MNFRASSRQSGKMAGVTFHGKAGECPSSWPLWVGLLFAAAFDLAFWGPIFGWEWVDAAFAPLCHQEEERCIHIGSAAMAICSRCAGIYLGVVVGCARAMLERGLIARAGLWAILAVAGNGIEFVLEVAGVLENPLWIRAGLGLAMGWMVVEFARQRQRAGRQ